MTESTYRLALLAVLLVPLVSILVWSVLTAPETAPQTAPEPQVKAVYKADTAEHATAEHAALVEYDVHGEFPAIPDDSEAMQQLRQAMSGQMVRCAVCQSTVGHLYRVQLTDNAAFCCAPCATILEGSTQDGGTD